MDPETPDPAASFAAAIEAISDPNERAAEAAALVQEALNARGIRTVVVGGSAVAAWDPDLHVSADIDLVGAAVRSRFDDAFADLGLVRTVGRHWHHAALRLFV